jgi:hypothetical protein
MIKVYRKECGAKPVNKLSKSEADKVRATVAAYSRVDRPELLDFFMPTGKGKSAFHRLPALSPQVIDNRPLRLVEHADAGWVVPVSNLGRKAQSDPDAAQNDQSTAQSVLLWLKKHAAANGLCDPAELSVVVE